MKKNANYIFIFTLAIMFAVCPLKTASAQIGGYVGIWGGYTISPYASSEDSHGDRDHYNRFNLDIQETWMFGVKVGYTPPPFKYVSFEFEYSYLNPDIKRSVLVDRYEFDFVAVEGNVKLNNFMFNIIGKYPLGRFHPYIGAGLGFSYSDMSATATQSNSGVASSASVGKNYTSFAWELLTGVEIDITNNLSADIGYRYFATEIEFENNAEIVFENDTKINFATSMITLGLKFRF